MIENPRLGDLWGRFFVGTRRLGSFHNGRLVDGEGEAVTLLDPANETLLATYRDAGEALAIQLADSASRGGAAWRALPAAARTRVLWAIGATIRAHRAPLAEMEAMGAGKPIRDCLAEIEAVAEMFEHYAGWCDKLAGDVLTVPGDHFNYVRREPYGVVLAITPCTAPLFAAAWAAAPALAAGNAVILKPSETTPLTTLALARLACAAGLPERAITVAVGLGPTTGQALVRANHIGKISVTGSMPAGRAVARSAAELIRPCALALGGKAATIVFADADLDAAVSGACSAAFSSLGHGCIAGSRLLVQRAIHDRFLERLVATARELTIGMPLEPTTRVGPCATRRHFVRLEALVAEARAEGAEVMLGGGRPDDRPKGYFFAPTVLAKATNAMKVAREELVGPLVAVIAFEVEAEAVAIANDTSYGLAGGVWTADAVRSHRVASALQAGTVWINGHNALGTMSPFGGYRQSGYGRHSGREALLEYTQTKSIWVATEPGSGKDAVVATAA